MIWVVWKSDMHSILPEVLRTERRHWELLLYETCSHPRMSSIMSSDGLEGKLFRKVEYTDWIREISSVLCARMHVCSGFCGCSWVLSVVYHGGAVAVLMNSCWVSVCVSMLRLCVLSSLENEGLRWVLIWEPHQLGLRRCQPLGQILSNSPSVI